MVPWTFDGVILPGGDTGHVEVTGSPSGCSERLPGRYALPGLVDAHAHLTVLGDHTLGDEALARERLEEYAAAGVATVRDVGGRSEVTLHLANLPQPGLPAVLAAGRFLAPAGRYFPGMHEPVTAQGLLATALGEISGGATWLKLIGDFPLLDPAGRPVPGSLAPTYDLDTVKDLLDLAHAHGARVAVHTQSRHVNELVTAGLDSVEHGEWISEDGVDALGERAGAWTPTLAAITGVPTDAPAKRRAYAAEASERLRMLLPRAVASGVRVLAGTDNAASVAHEIALLARHGLTPEQALAAGSTAAAWLYPSLQVADSLVTYETDPRDDPEVLFAPAAVVIRGQRVR